jgi:hypothetical protein
MMVQLRETDVFVGQAAQTLQHLLQGQRTLLEGL